MGRINPIDNSPDFIKKAVNLFTKSGRFSSGKPKNDKTAPPMPKSNPSEELSSRLKPKQYAIVTKNGRDYFALRDRETGDPIFKEIKEGMAKNFTQVSREQLVVQNRFNPDEWMKQRVSDRVLVQEVMRRFTPPNDNGCIVLDQDEIDGKVVIHKEKGQVVAERVHEDGLHEYLENKGLFAHPELSQFRLLTLEAAEKAAAKRLKKEKVDLEEEEKHGLKLSDKEGYTFRNTRNGFTVVSQQRGMLVVKRFRQKQEADDYFKSAQLNQIAKPSTPRNSISRELPTPTENEKRVGNKLEEKQGTIRYSFGKYRAISKQDGQVKVEEFKTEREARTSLSNKNLNIQSYKLDGRI